MGISRPDADGGIGGPVSLRAPSLAGWLLGAGAPPGSLTDLPDSCFVWTGTLISGSLSGLLPVG